MTILAYRRGLLRLRPSLASIVWLCILLVRVSPLSASSPSIQLENSTYTPWYYRVAFPGGQYGNWITALPGQRTSYNSRALVIQISQAAGQPTTFSLSAGSTYIWQRDQARGAPRLVSASGYRCRPAWTPKLSQF